MKTYFAIVHKDEDSAYGVTFPDLPGCFSAADRIEDVMPNAAEALALWFEDQPQVEPHALETITQEHAGELASGAFLMGIPLLSDPSRTVRANVSIDAGMLADIDEAARARKMTRSAFLITAARNEMLGAH